MSPERATTIPLDLEQNIFHCRVADAQISMRLSHCPPACAEEQRQVQLTIRACISRLQELMAR